MLVFNKNIKIKKKKILIISGKNSFYLSGVKNYLFFHDCEVHYFFKKKKIPDIYELEKIINFKKKFKPDIILGVGGGSVLDLAKMTASLSNIKFNFKKIKQSQFKNSTNLILVPTTAGSGSEATNFSVLFKNKQKYSLISDQMIPNKVYFFSNSLKNLDKHSKLSSALDILCQSIESMFSLDSNSQSLSCSKRSLNIIRNNMKKYINGDSSTFKKMFESSNFAGRAINKTKTNVPHAISYYLTSTFKVQHGFAVFLNLYGFLNFLYKQKKTSIFVNKRFDYLFQIFKIRKKENKKLILLFKKINTLVNFDVTYRKFLIDRRKNLAKIIKETNLERLKNSPIKITKEDLKEIILYNT